MPRHAGTARGDQDNVRLRSASGETLRSRVSVLHRKALARAERENAQLACMFVHEDWDDVDSDRCDDARTRVQTALDDVAGRSHYVLAAWEIEAWLLLFPAALKDLAGAWSVPSTYLGRDTGLLADPKRILRRECSAGSRQYAEADAPTLLQLAVVGGYLEDPAGSNRSWSRFRAGARSCCTVHLSTHRG